MIIKLNSINTNKKKSYRVENNTLYIDNEPIEITDDGTVTWVTEGLEDFNAITKIDEDIVIELNVFTDQNTVLNYFSNTTDSPSIFPSTKIEDKTVWQCDISKMEGMAW